MAMNEMSRVAIGITIWVGVALCFLGAGISLLSTDGFDTAHPESASTAEHSIERATPESVGIDGKHLEHIATTMERYIDLGTIDGGVVGIVRHDKLVYLEAFGRREHDGEAMTTDTRFDLASLTKPVATATAIMQLAERGIVQLDEPVAGIIPDFEDWIDPKSKEQHTATIGHLMSHTSGLRPYVAVERLAEEYPDCETLNKGHLLDYIAHSERLGAPGTVCRYSCLNYIVLGEIVESRTGQSLDRYAEENIFAPLGMSSTRFTPDADYASQAAPTSPWDSEEELRGVVNDPLARILMAGVSGNAGLFSTAEDLAVYTAMLLNGGEWNGVKIVTPTSVEMLFRRPYEEFERTMAWEQLEAEFPTSETTYTHNGATGTSIVLDRERDMAIILLTNRTHAKGSASDIKQLRSAVRTICSYAISE